MKSYLKLTKTREQPESALWNTSTVDQFSNLDVNKTRILGYKGKEAHFLSVKYLTGLVQNRQIFYVAPWGASAPEHVGCAG